MFSKVDVNGENAADLYAWLKDQKPGEGDAPDIVWNFTKFLIDRNGEVVARFEPQVTPEEIAEELPKYLD